MIPAGGPLTAAELPVECRVGEPVASGRQISTLSRRWCVHHRNVGYRALSCLSRPRPDGARLSRFSAAKHSETTFTDAGITAESVAPK